jgi:4-hydroxy-tetrahydrodipicolinate reductase
MQQRVLVIGAARRMGRRLVHGVLTAPDLALVGAVERRDCPELGQDAGILAGDGACGVMLSADLAPLLKQADAVIDFSVGDVLADVRAAVSAGCGIVLGTTALDDAAKKELATLAKGGGRVVFAPNMSVGVNVLFKVAADVARVLGEEYDIEIVEMHHRKKKDAPSGTAVGLAEAVAGARGIAWRDHAAHGREGLVGERPCGEIGMHAVRGGDVVGDHTVIFATDGERVELTHKASSRDTFVHGALRAVRFLATAKAGLYTMQDVLGLT